MARKKIIIVGAGPGGLTAAMILARRGFDVTVYECKPEVGGRNAALRIGDYTFDTGPTFLMMNFVLKDVFNEAGRKVEDYLQFRRLEPMYRLAFDDLEVLPTTDRDGMFEAVRRLFPGNEHGYHAFLERERKRFEYMFPCLQKDYSSFSSLFCAPLMKALPHLSLGRSLFSNLGRYFSAERLKLSFTFQAKYLGMSPWECPAAFTILPYVEHAYGVYHVIGGLNAISLAMARVAGELGCAVHTGTRVASLMRDGRRVTGVELEDGTRAHADEVIINADFAHAMSTLVPPGVLRKYSVGNLRKRRYSCSTFMLYLGLDTRYILPHHNVFFARDYRANVADIFEARRLSDDISFYVQNASVTDSTLAPEGHSTIYVLVPVPNNTSGIDWAREKTRFRDLVLDSIARRTEMKDIRSHITAEKVITPADWEDEHGVFLGATFNLAHTIGQMLYFRPRNRFEELRNCWLTGGGTHPGSGLPTIYESARITANLICESHGVPFVPPAGLSSKQPVLQQFTT
ncbi:phytoene desaturase [bacterium]|nr:phytoene desaturase [bacterium]